MSDDDGEVEPHTLRAVLAAFWTALVLLFMVRTVTEDWTSRLSSLGRRLPEALFGAILCWLMCLVLRRADPRSIRARLLWVGGLSLPMGCIFSVVNAWAIYLSSLITHERCGYGAPCLPAFVRNLAIEYSVNFTFVFLAWGALFLGMRATAQALAAERRLGRARDEARLAELRALRYQVNPHFLFNSLNSLGTLVDRGDTVRARGMIGEMSSFLRYGLAIDPLADVELEDEVEMQRRYLEIERVRFAHRLTVQIDLEGAVRRARLPSLLLQPLVENAVKHGVATTSAPVTVSIFAETGPDRTIRIAVEDDAPLDELHAEIHLGIGLRNVTERLRARFGSEAILRAGARPGGGFRAEIIMPQVRS
jgi:two-component system, LytTR family, sensor kinase